MGSAWISLLKRDRNFPEPKAMDEKITDAIHSLE